MTSCPLLQRDALVLHDRITVTFGRSLGPARIVRGWAITIAP